MPVKITEKKIASEITLVLDDMEATDKERAFFTSMKIKSIQYQTEKAAGNELYSLVDEMLQDMRD